MGFEKVDELCVYLCSNCLEVSSTATKLLGAWKRQQSNDFLCGSCISAKLSPEEEMNYKLGPIIAPFFELCPL